MFDRLKSNTDQYSLRVRSGEISRKPSESDTGSVTVHETGGATVEEEEEGVEEEASEGKTVS